MNTTKDLTKESPRSPRLRLGEYPILARAIDKGRAALQGTVGDYHFDCPLDNYLFGFKEVKGADVKQLLADGATDGQVVAWLDTHGASKTDEELKAFAKKVEAARPYDDPEKRAWFIEQCTSFGIDPVTSTLFDLLEKDDAASFKR